MYQAIEQTHSAIVITDKMGNIDFVNPRLTELTGYTCAEVKGKNPRILNSGTSDSEFYKHLWETILNNETWRGSFTNNKKNGDIYHEEAIISPVTKNKGEIVNFIAVKLDITDRIATEDKLKECEEKIKQLLNYNKKAENI